LLGYSGKAATRGKRGIIQNYLQHIKKKSHDRHILSNYLTIIYTVIYVTFDLGENYNVE